MIDSVDEEFFSYFGNLVGITTFEELLDGLHISEIKFKELFPFIKFNKNKIETKQLPLLRDFFSKSEKYKNYLLSKAREERELVKEYFKQNINLNEKFCFIDYWGRGYTQNCLSNILSDLYGTKQKTFMFYFRSIMPSDEQNFRFNFSTNINSLLPIEAVFTNCPTSTVYGYKRTSNGKIEPLMYRNAFDAQLYFSMENLLPTFVELVCEKNLDILNNTEVLREFSRNAFDWFKCNKVDSVFVNVLAPLMYNDALYGELKEFAPEITIEMLNSIALGTPISSFTKSIELSLARSNKDIKSVFRKDFSLDKEKFINLFNNKLKLKGKVLAIDNKTQQKMKLLNKLELHPEKYFNDSSNFFVKYLGKFLSLKYSPQILRKCFIKIIKNRLK